MLRIPLILSLFPYTTLFRSVILILKLGKSEVELQVWQFGFPPCGLLQKLGSAFEVLFVRAQQAELVVSPSCCLPIELRGFSQLGALLRIRWFTGNDHRPPFHAVDGILQIIPTAHAAAQVNLEALLVLHCGIGLVFLSQRELLLRLLGFSLA